MVKPEYFFLDVGFFVNENNLEKSVKLVEDSYFGEKPKIVIASALQGLFNSGDSERDIWNDERLLPAFSAWGYREPIGDDPSTVGNLLTNKYRELLETLQQNCEMTFAFELVGDVVRIGENSIYKKDVLRKFRRTPMVGHIVWEKLAVCNKVPSSVICRSKKFSNMLEKKLGIPLLKFQSPLKEHLAKHTGIGLPLYFISHNYGPQLVDFATEFGFEGSADPLELIAGTAVKGLAVMADG